MPDFVTYAETVIFMSNAVNKKGYSMCHMPWHRYQATMTE